MNPIKFATLKSILFDQEGDRVQGQSRSVQIARLGILAWMFTLPFWMACSKPSDTLDSNQTTDPEVENSVTPNEGMDFFHGSLEDALAFAEEENKLVFVDVYTIWCGPCVVMQESVFPLPEVGEFFNERFVNYKLDAENEEQNGPELAAHYDIGIYPTYLILDHEGNELNRASSALPSDQFILLVQRMLGESESDFEQLQERYDAGERSTEFLQQYLLAVTVELSFLEVDNQDIESVQAYYSEIEKYNTIANEYFSSRPYSDLINEIDVELILQFRANVPRGDDIVEFVIEHYDEFLEVSTDAAISQLVLDATKTSVAEAAQAGDEKFTDYINALDEFPLKKAVDYERNRYPKSSLLPEQLKYTWETHYLVAIEDWEGLHGVYKSRFAKWGDDTTARNYSYAARSLVRSDNSKHREISLDWSERAYAMDPNDLWVAAYHVRVLMGVEQPDEAKKVFEEYRSSLSDSKVDQENLLAFYRLTPASLRDDKQALE